MPSQTLGTLWPDMVSSNNLRSYLQPTLQITQMGMGALFDAVSLSMSPKFTILNVQLLFLLRVKQQVFH